MKNKNASLLLAAYIIFSIIPKTSKKEETNIAFNEEYTIDNTLPYATYNDKDIYIIKDEQIESINDNNIYIFDKRNTDNPTMSIYNSYKIKNTKEIEDIISILLNYEFEYPSNWDRTIISMKKEWLIHNICHSINYKKERTSQVDLDNNDEEDFSNIISILSRIKEIIDINEENQEVKTHTLKK